MVAYSVFALAARMKEIHFERGVEDLRERHQLQRDQSRRIPVHRNHRTPGHEKKGCRRLDRPRRKIVRFFSEEIVESLAPPMSDEAVKRRDPLTSPFGEPGPGQKRNSPWMIQWDPGL